MKALVVDDSSVIRKMLSFIVERLGFETETAENGIEALKKLRESGPFDLAMLDWEMPLMNGLDLTREIKKTDEFADLKILMITTHNSMNDLMAAMSLGIDDYLMKPIEEDAVTERIRMLGLIE